MNQSDARAHKQDWTEFRPRRLRRCWVCLVCIVVLTASHGSISAAEPKLALAIIRADLTPQPGDAACVGFIPKISTIEHPLELRGILLQKRGAKEVQTFVIAALDYQGLCNSSYDLLRRSIADAVGTTPDHVALQSLHQHTAPVLDVDGAKLLNANDPARWKAHAAFADQMAERAAHAARQASVKLQPVTRIIATQAKAVRVASNRRVVQPDGSIIFRGSSTKEPTMHEAPEGLIDPWVRTLSYFNDEHNLVQMHYYATHPQSFYNDERISWDVPGISRQRLQDETGIFQIYFTGCGGNVAMGKYNDGTRETRDSLSERLYQSMKASASAARPNAAAPRDHRTSDTGQIVKDLVLSELNEHDIAWSIVPLKFVPREDGEFDKRRAGDLLRPEQPFNKRLKAAMATAWFDRLRAGHQVELSRLRIGSIQIVHLPGEPFVEFQLFAQQVSPKSFVCVAGYGECGIWYYGPDSIFADRGGYEQTWSFAEPCQELIENAIKKQLTSP